MPQMAPMNWLILFIFFMLTFFMLLTIIYFNFFKLSNKNFFLKNQIKNYNKFI
uniref:ATP synthase complex subunit 8 n=1 Tax=Colopha setaricola TaxID=1308588 RepID=A0A096VKB3_9HEMI|nr:ATP synthase F0 subunit 8 [Colopha setaricola]AHK17972.1 F-ATPase subunit 8 [Colopha setaricola]